VPDASSHTSCGLNGPRWSPRISWHGIGPFIRNVTVKGRKFGSAGYGSEDECRVNAYLSITEWSALVNLLVNTEGLCRG